MINLENLKIEHARWIQLHGGDPRSVSKGQLDDSRTIVQLIEAIECAVEALRILLDDEANAAQVRIARNAAARISALIGKGEGEK
jgi:hypothetical protein